MNSGRFMSEIVPYPGEVPASKEIRAAVEPLVAVKDTRKGVNPRERWWFVDAELGAYQIRYDERVMCESWLRLGNKWKAISEIIEKELGIKHSPEVIRVWVKDNPRVKIQKYLTMRMNQLGYANKTKEEWEAEVGRQAFTNEEVPMSKVASQKMYAQVKGWLKEREFSGNQFAGQVINFVQKGE